VVLQGWAFRLVRRAQSKKYYALLRGERGSGGRAGFEECDRHEVRWWYEDLILKSRREEERLKKITKG
jgi:hypothetical protein